MPPSGRKAVLARSLQEPRRRRLESHRAIVEAATSLAARHGYNAVTVEAIAAKAGVGKQTIYRWWPGKAALYAEVYGQLAAPDALRADTGTMTGDLERLLLSLFRIYDATPAKEILAGLVAEAQSDPAALVALRERLAWPRRDLLLDAVRRGRGRGELRPGLDPEAVVDVLSGAIWFRLLLGHAPLDKRYATQLVRLVSP
jgi:AcrR family transcriptional regulator